MYGLSAMGKAQLMCAMMNPPSLKCIVPNVAVMENPAMMTNGVVNLGWLAHIDEQLYEQNVLDPAPPVDEDTDGSMLQEAIEIHKSNPSVLKEREIAYCHDDYLPFWNSRLYVEAYYPNFLHAIDDGSIACYIIGGWKDFYAHDSLSWYCSLNKAPKRIAMGPWLHHESEQSISPYNYFTEHLRWYDYWLKDIDNGIMDEPPVLFYQNGAEEWRYLPDFPLPETKRVDYYLRDRASGTVNSINDGSMTKQRPDEKNRKIEYVVDYSMTKKGYVDRFYYTAPGSTDYTAFDEKSLTFTTVPFAEDVEMVGFPVVTLWFSANAKDVDFYFNLQEIDESGASRNISEQRLRASFRKTATPAFNNLGLPYHRLCRQDQEDLPIGQPVKGEVTLLPISNTIQKGHRLRLTINNYDDNWNTPVLDPAPVVTIYHSAEYPSGVSFPIITKSL